LSISKSQKRKVFRIDLTLSLKKRIAIFGLLKKRTSSRLSACNLSREKAGRRADGGSSILVTPGNQIFDWILFS
jgi:c-di-GMP-binding flagellar brake protein YcgR